MNEPVEWKLVGEEINSSGVIYEHKDILFKFLEDGSLEGSINFEVDNSFMGPQKISFTGAWTPEGNYKLDIKREVVPCFLKASLFFKIFSN